MNNISLTSCAMFYYVTLETLLYFEKKRFYSNILLHLKGNIGGDFGIGGNILFQLFGNTFTTTITLSSILAEQFFTEKR